MAGSRFPAVGIEVAVAVVGIVVVAEAGIVADIEVLVVAVVVVWVAVGSHILVVVEVVAVGIVLGFVYHYPNLMLVDNQLLLLVAGVVGVVPVTVSRS